MALERAVGVAWNASKPKPGDSAWSYEYDDEDAQDWDAPYDPRSQTPGCYGHFVTYDTDDCSGDVKRVDVTAPYTLATRTCEDFLEGEFMSQLCESMVDDCCKKNWYMIAQSPGASVRMCLSEQSLNDAVATCAWIGPDLQ